MRDELNVQDCGRSAASSRTSCTPHRTGSPGHGAEAPVQAARAFKVGPDSAPNMHYHTTPMDRSALCRPIGVGERRTARRSRQGASLRIEPRASSPSRALRPAWLTFRLPASSTPGPGSRPFLSSLPALGKANCHVRERKSHPFCDSGSQSSCSLPKRPVRLDARP